MITFSNQGVMSFLCEHFFGKKSLRLSKVRV
jgi:hypothetical protein